MRSACVHSFTAHIHIIRWIYATFMWHTDCARVRVCVCAVHMYECDAVFFLDSHGKLFWAAGSLLLWLLLLLWLSLLSWYCYWTIRIHFVMCWHVSKDLFNNICLWSTAASAAIAKQNAFVRRFLSHVNFMRCWLCDGFKIDKHRTKNFHKNKMRGNGDASYRWWFI